MFEVDAPLVAALGSETRFRVLAVLASARRPMTAYRVGKIGGVRLPKAYEEIERLFRADILERSGNRWILKDADLRELLRKRTPVIVRPAPSDVRRLYARFRKMPPPHWGGLGPIRYDVERRREKDELLVRHGLRPSVTDGA